jgi:hypothetical protein
MASHNLRGDCEGVAVLAGHVDHAFAVTAVIHDVHYRLQYPIDVLMRRPSLAEEHPGLPPFYCPLGMRAQLASLAASKVKVKARAAMPVWLCALEQ